MRVKSVQGTKKKCQPVTCRSLVGLHPAFEMPAGLLSSGGVGAWQENSSPGFEQFGTPSIARAPTQRRMVRPSHSQCGLGERVDRNRQIGSRFLTQLPSRLTVTCVLVVAGLIRPAFADEYDVFNVVVGADATYHSNIFARPDFLNPQSDTITKGYVGLRIDKPYGQQRFQLDATANAYRYDKFSNLNFDGIDYGAAWLWHLTPRVNGTLKASRTEVPTLFADSIGQQRNVLTTEEYLFDLDGQISGGWHALAGLSRRKEDYELPQATALPSFTADRGEVGLKYLFPSGNWISGVYRSIKGDYNNRLTDLVTFTSSGFDGYEVEGRGRWALTGKSTLLGRLTYLDRTDDSFPQRNFSGTAGDLRFQWTPTTKLRYIYGAVRDISAYQTNFSSYRKTDTLLFTGNWQVTFKTALSFRLSYSEVDFRGPVVALSTPERRDTERLARAGVRWAPTRTVELGADVQYNNRSSNNPFAAYDDTVVTLRGEVTF